LFLVFPYFFVSVPCATLNWPYRQLFDARKQIVSYRMNKQRSKWVNIHNLVCFMISISSETFCVYSTSLTFHCNANAVVILWLKSYLLRIPCPNYSYWRVTVTTRPPLFRSEL